MGERGLDSSGEYMAESMTRYRAFGGKNNPRGLYEPLLTSYPIS